MGMYVDIYTQREHPDDLFYGEDCTNGGESSYVKGFCVTNVDGPFNPCEDYPAAKLIKQEFGFGCSLKIVPESKLDKATSFGGNFASTSDSRFGDKCRELMGEDIGNVYGLGPVKIHDRVE